MSVDAAAPAPGTDEDILSKLGDLTPRTAWRIYARNTARALFDQVREAERTQHLDQRQVFQAGLIRQGISRAASASSYSPWGAGEPAQPGPAPRSAFLEALKDWYSGAGVETAWAELHRADERLLLVARQAAVADRILDIDAALRSNLKEDDPRLTPATLRLRALSERFGPAAQAAREEEEAAAAAAHARTEAERGWSPDLHSPPDLQSPPDAPAAPPRIGCAEREELRGYERLANTASDEARANVRSLRNLLIVVGFVVSLGLAVVAAVHAVAPGFIDLSGPVPAKPDARAVDAIEVWEVVLVGAIGGMIAAVFTITKLGGFSGPYRLPVYQALIRVPAGALVALAAVLLLQSGQISGLSGQSGLSVLAIALIFGYAPDVLLRSMDQKATSLLGQAQNKDDPMRPPLVKPRVQS